MNNNSNQTEEFAVGIKLALSEASLGDLDVTYVHLGRKSGALQAEVERWAPSFDGKITAFVREGSYFDLHDLDGVRTLVVPDRIRIRDLNAFLLVGRDIAVFEIGSRVYLQTEPEFFVEGNKIVNLIGSAVDRFHELKKLISLEEKKNA